MVEPAFEAKPRDEEVPLVVDLDGTLIRSDFMIESFFALLAKRPLAAFASVASLARGVGAFKAALAAAAPVDAATLPVNRELVDWLKAEKARGRALYLASASDRKFVDAMAAELALFDGVFASDEHRNLAGENKAAALVEAFGRGGFDYVGNSSADVPVWMAAREAIVAGATERFARGLRGRVHVTREIGVRATRFQDYLRALRVHQWVKNFLIFIPALAAHEFDAGAGALLALAFLSFSLCASSAYALNDLLDLPHDRLHPTKRSRPFASGAVPLGHAVMLVPALLAVGLALAATIGIRFFGCVLIYYATTLLYSFWLKRKMSIDVLTLACLYGLRVIAGAVAVGLPLSAWLVGFLLFLFLSLAIIKRCTELITSIERGAGDPAGRGYQVRDLPVLESMAAASGYLAVLVFALYIASPQVVALYRAPDRLWLICVILLYWISRMLVMTRRGLMHDDPIVFAAKDKMSLASGALAVAILLSASI
ncbi:MAG TPA: UbiA family prenyltransferase [Alphaproteobacteria bacterium]|nr:UbiA family prenyltransferase [Alphaproteobacteria bacterium]